MGYLSTLFKKGTKFAKRHKYFPAFLQTEIISKNLLVDFDEDVFIEQSEVALKKAFDRNLKRSELDVLGCVGDAKKKISVRTFDGFIKDVSKIHGYVHPFFLNVYLKRISLRCTNIEHESDKFAC